MKCKEVRKIKWDKASSFMKVSHPVSLFSRLNYYADR
jgi:hypothetical protein